MNRRTHLFTARHLATGAVVGLLLLLSACSGDTPGDDPTGSASPSDTAGLPAECAEWAEAPGVDEPITTNAYVGSAVWEEVDGYIVFDAQWRNETDLVAVNVTADFRFFFDGEEITDELPAQETLAQFRPYTIDVMLPAAVADEEGIEYRSEETTIDMPPTPEWAESNGGKTTLEAVPVVERWCVLDDGDTV
ncbi:hypothetical protein LX16_0396 [Stackebrandtia albiflava]|uniref:Lipoprotein n=1 Tax=Stackebrandtia albiflava TaxID=406432 RepID=A0A562VA72_9ACTN|nr:hypothetical protein [Stackebrandtia albiflava]TWJ14707.1 hypothetical protein LX16_0396 [Stackebrandtia albiflava]